MGLRSLIFVALAGCSTGAKVPPRGDPETVARIPLRAPAVPLVVRDPYLNVWSLVDRPAQDWPRAWTGAARPMAVAARIDGRMVRLLGLEPAGPEMPLESVEVRPTRTTYKYFTGGVAVALSFVTPLVPRDDVAMALPGVWIEWAASVEDGKEHDVALYIDVEGAWARANIDGELAWHRVEVAAAGGAVGYSVAAAPGSERPYVEQEEMPDWGELLFVAPMGGALAIEAGPAASVRKKFAVGESLSGAVDPMFRPASSPTAFAFAWRFPSLSGAGERRRLFLGHGRAQVVRFFDQDCRAAWTAIGDLAAVAARALDGAPAWREKIEARDAELLADAEREGGPSYAALIALAHRQAFGTTERCKTETGGDYLFMKELASGSFIQTVDAVFPASPAFLLEDPELMRRLLAPSLDAEEKRAGAPYPLHDLGFYPRAESDPHFPDTPVETAGDLLLLVGAYTKFSGDVSLAKEHEKLLAGWADFLVANGSDPPVQLSSDDFTGPLEHSTHLAAKASIAVGAWGQVARRLGSSSAGYYEGEARRMTGEWVARADTGDHLGLTLDGEGWSLKYNLYYDRLLGLALVPPEVARREVAWHRAHARRYGAALDSRFPYGKVDWLTWVASLAEDRADFVALVDPIARFLDETEARAAFPDIYDVDAGTRPWAFTARPVVGGIHAKLLLARP